MVYIIIAWAILGIHSGYYLVKGVTKRFDFETSDIPQLIIAILIPVVTHIATYLTYYYPEYRSKVLFKSRL